MTDDDWNVLMQEKVTRAPWWKHKPYFNLTLHDTYPSIWLGWWCIVLEREPLRLRISFLPD